MPETLERPVVTPPERKLPVPEVTELERPDLEVLYHQAVGKDPQHRLLSIPELIAGIENPAAEFDRLALLDQEEDQNDRRNRR